MKKKMLVVLGVTAFLLCACTGKEEIVQTEQLEVSEMTEIQEIVVVETAIVENTEAFIHGTENSEEADEKIIVHTDEAEPDVVDGSYILSTGDVKNPNNLPVLTGNETEEGLYWDTEWQHETYVEFGPDGEVYFDKYGNTYSCPVDDEGNLLVE